MLVNDDENDFTITIKETFDRDIDNQQDKPQKPQSDKPKDN